MDSISDGSAELDSLKFETDAGVAEAIVRRSSNRRLAAHRVATNDRNSKFIAPDTKPIDASGGDVADKMGVDDLHSVQIFYRLSTWTTIPLLGLAELGVSRHRLDSPRVRTDSPIYGSLRTEVNPSS